MDIVIKAGDKIRCTCYVMGRYADGTRDYTVEEFRNTLGIFETEQHRKAGKFMPLCEMYERGPDSQDEYISNFGTYISNMVPAFMQLPS